MSNKIVYKIWVGNLHYQTTVGDLNYLFGSTRAAINLDDRNRSLGHGYIIAKDEADFNRMLGCHFSINNRLIHVKKFIEENRLVKSAAN
jgi:hypothetical protein